MSTQVAKRGKLLSLAAVMFLLAAVLAATPVEASRYLPSPTAPAQALKLPQLEDLDQVDAGGDVAGQSFALLTSQDLSLFAAVLLLDDAEREQVLAHDRFRLFPTSTPLPRRLEPLACSNLASGHFFTGLECNHLGKQDLTPESRWTLDLYAFVAWGPHRATDPMGEEDLTPGERAERDHLARMFSVRLEQFQEMRDAGIDPPEKWMHSTTAMGHRLTQYSEHDMVPVVYSPLLPNLGEIIRNQKEEALHMASIPGRMLEGDPLAYVEAGVLVGGAWLGGTQTGRNTVVRVAEALGPRVRAARGWFGRAFRRSGGEAEVAVAPKSGETNATRIGKEVHASAAAERRTRGDFDLVNQAIPDGAGNPVLVPHRVDLRTGVPQPGTHFQEVVPDAVSFRRGLIIDDKPLGRPIMKDRQEIIRAIRGYEVSQGTLPRTVAIPRYDPATGQFVRTDLHTPADFLPRPQ